MARRHPTFGLETDAAVLSVDKSVNEFALFKGSVYEVAQWLLRVPESEYEKYIVWVLDYPQKIAAKAFLNMATEPAVERKEAVNHPSHYNSGKIEVITFIEDQDLNFSLGNALKYICRAGRKDPDKAIEDLEKARTYIQFEIDRRKREQS